MKAMCTSQPSETPAEAYTFDYRDIRTGEPAKGSRTLEAKAVLDRAFEQSGGKDHPGLLHLWCHLMEMSARPEDAIAIANRLRGLVPDAGHLHHMPSHLDVLAGRW